MNSLSRTKAHIEKAEENLLEARSLLAAGYPDGTCNRAYYSLFHCIIALLHTTSGLIPKTHTGAQTEFRRLFIKTGKFDEMYSNSISELFNLRQGSDYEVDFDISIEDATDTVEQATQFLTDTQAYLRENGFIE